MADPILRFAKHIDLLYLDWIRLRSCLVCGVEPVDPDHLKAVGWREPKRDDYSAVPFCREHHSERGSIGDSRFESKYNLNLWQEAWVLTKGYLLVRLVEANKEIEELKKERRHA